MEPILGFNRSARVAFSFKIKFLIPPPPISIIIFVTYGKIAWVAASELFSRFHNEMSCYKQTTVLHQHTFQNIEIRKSL